jgi:hypothetical protein
MRLPRLLSLIFCAAALAVAQRATTYNDPQNRFTLQTPAGWSATALNADAVQFAAAPAYLTVMVFQGGEPETLLAAIARQTGAQWHSFAEARRGATQLGGRAGTYVTYAGTNPKGVDAYLQMLAVADGPRTFLLMMSAPKADYARVRAAFDQMELSFRMGTGEPDAPAPAGAAKGRSPNK